MAKSNKNTCEKCDGACCGYVSVHIDAPNSLDDFDEIRWFVSHKDVVVYKDCDGDWLVEFNSRCKFLGRNNRCTDYENRPGVCGDYDPEKCVKTSTVDPMRIAFREPSDVEKHVAKRWPKKKKEKKSGGKR
ncbi:MAG: YkgJ family cysteine cluster protein [bacterium]